MNLTSDQLFHQKFLFTVCFAEQDVNKIDECVLDRKFKRKYELYIEKLHEFNNTLNIDYLALQIHQLRHHVEQIKGTTLQHQMTHRCVHPYNVFRQVNDPSELNHQIPEEIKEVRSSISDIQDMPDLSMNEDANLI